MPRYALSRCGSQSTQSAGACRYGSARLEPELRASALKIIEGSGLTSSDVIRRVYEYIAIMGEVPEFIKTAEYDVRFKNRVDPFERMQGWIEEGPFSQLDFSGLTDDEIAAELGRDAP